MATFNWTAKGTQGATYDGTFPSHYKKANDNYYAANLTVLSESLLKNGKVSYYIFGNYNLDIDYKDINYNEQSGTLSYNGYTFKLKQYGNPIGTGEVNGYFVENIYDSSINGYIKKDQTYYSETGVEEVITGNFDYDSNYFGKSLSLQRTYYISGNDTFNGSKKDDKLSSGLGNDIIYGNEGDDTLKGESGSDIIKGGDGFDNIYGGTGNDSLHGNDGNDYIDGGNGTDVANFEGKFSDYSFVQFGSNFKIVDNRLGKNKWTDTLKSVELLDFSDKKSISPITAHVLQNTTQVSNNSTSTSNEYIINKLTRKISSETPVYFGKSFNYKFYNLGEDRYALKTDNGYDEITGVKSLQFSDKTLNLEKDIAGTFDQITGLNTKSGEMFRLYNAAFARFPDTDGLRYWIGKYSSRENDLRAIASSFLASEEFTEKYGSNVSNETYVNNLYKNVLGRDADTEGLNYWVDNISNGIETKYEALLGFSESTENKTLFTEMTGFS